METTGVTRNSSLLFAAGAVSLFAITLAGCGTKTTERAEAPKEVSAPKKEAPPERYKFSIETSKGPIVVEVQREWAPRGADRFWELATSGFYDESRFYRVIRGSIAQFGINKDPKVNRFWREMAIPDDPPKLKNVKGTLAFAKIGPNSRSTQVFLNLRDNPELDRQKFVPIGKVVAGMDVAAQIYAKYGEISNRGGGGPDAVKAETLGNSYLEGSFTQMDYIKRIERVQ